MKRTLPLLLALGLVPLLGSALAAPIRLPNLPLSVEPGERLRLLSDAGIQKAFPDSHRPEAMFLSSDGKVSLSFEWRQAKLGAADLNTMLTRFPAVIRAQVPGIRSLKQSLITVNGHSWADFTFVAPGKAGDVRRELLITNLQGRMLVLTVSSSLADYGRNEAAVRTLTASLRPQ